MNQVSWTPGNHRTAAVFENPSEKSIILKYLHNPSLVMNHALSKRPQQSLSKIPPSFKNADHSLQAGAHQLKKKHKKNLLIESHNTTVENGLPFSMQQTPGTQNLNLNPASSQIQLKRIVERQRVQLLHPGVATKAFQKPELPQTFGMLEVNPIHQG